MSKEEKPTNATLPLLEFQHLERIAAKLDWSTAAFARLLLRFALPRWPEAWKELGDKVAADNDSSGQN